MNRRLRMCITCLFVHGCLTATALGHPPFGLALKAKYELRLVTCYACHVKGKDESGKLLGREHRNEFGQALHEALKEKNITARIEAAKELSFLERKEVNEAATADFLKALEQLEDKPAAESGKTWRELIESGEMEGVKLKE
ncbi:MAG: hypothetical protein KY475_00760 [Planctomycetes bacterium]|nr:hypothetical protein [Planctomycetota bacterium]